MTREEELDWLYRLKSKIYVYMPKEWIIPMNNALDMVIKELEQEPCEDAISRQAVLDLIADYDLSMGQVVRGIHALPPVTPQQKMGHWKFVQRGKFIDICCSECGYVRVKDYAYNYTIDQLDEQEKKDFLAKSHMNFCECCGVKMQAESEDE